MYLVIATARACATFSLLIWRAEMTVYYYYYFYYYYYYYHYYYYY